IAHPSVATIYALEEIDGHLFIASEFVEGHTLRTEIERGPLDPRRAVAIAIDIARAVCAAHEVGVVHRDLEPENALVAAGEVLEALERERPHPHYLRAQASVADASARWWWEFHQSAVAIVYAVMVWPTWIARTVIGGREGNAVFVAVLAAAIVAVTLRLHLW